MSIHQIKRAVRSNLLELATNIVRMEMDPVPSTVALLLMTAEVEWAISTIEAEIRENVKILTRRDTGQKNDQTLKRHIHLRLSELRRASEAAAEGILEEEATVDQAFQAVIEAAVFLYHIDKEIS